MSNVYVDLLRYARRASRRPDEAEDILQSVLLSAVKLGRADLSLETNRRWLFGAIRRQAAFEARTVVRRRLRERSFAPVAAPEPEADDFRRLCAKLPGVLRITAQLIGTGHSKSEILWLLRISDATLRQRIAEIRRRLSGCHMSIESVEGLAGPLAFGLIRKNLVPILRESGAFLASHDPDGHVFLLIAPSQNANPRQHCSATAKEKPDHVCKLQDR
jgi:DNA-directed RNA polymerase specialized sigma24 family protein